jgi:peptide chain release factor 1
MSDTTVESGLLARLQEASERLAKTSEELNDPAVARDPSRLAQLGREYAKLRQLVEPYKEYRRLSEEVAGHESLIADEGQDSELRELAQQELPELRQRCEAVMEQIRDAVVAGDEGTVSSIIMEIRAGTGGEEAALFARDLVSMYQRYCERKGFKLEMMDSSPTDLGGFREAMLNIKGEGVYRCLGYEGGGHRVQRVPKTEAQGRIHTSAATVAVLPEPDAVDVQIDWDKDVLEHVSRAGGPGGQNVNKVSSAIRLEHVPTGITVSMRDEKSQHKNRDKARRILISRVYELHESRDRAERDEARRTMIGSGDRSDRVRTYNFPQNRCTDHRINLDIYNLQGILDGDLDELIAALQLRDREMRLKNL